VTFDVPDTTGKGTLTLRLPKVTLNANGTSRTFGVSNDAGTAEFDMSWG
jgi:hypothetical protein